MDWPTPEFMAMLKQLQKENKRHDDAKRQISQVMTWASGVRVDLKTAGADDRDTFLTAIISLCAAASKIACNLSS